MRSLIVATGFLVLTSLFPSAGQAALLIDFNALPDQVFVGEQYGSVYSAPGQYRTAATPEALGVHFSGFKTFIDTPDRSYGIGSVIGYNKASSAWLSSDLPFSSLGLDYYFFAPGTLSLYSGERGSGELLSTIELGPNCTRSCLPGQLNLSFSPARSLSLAGSVGNLALDNLRLGSAVPEPSTWALLISGFMLVGAQLRRSRRRPSTSEALESPALRAT